MSQFCVLSKKMFVDCANFDEKDQRKQKYDEYIRATKIVVLSNISMI